MGKLTTCYIKVKSGFLSFDRCGQSHIAYKYTEDGKTLYEVRYCGSCVVLSSDDVIEHERYYLVFVISKATETNQSFAGAVNKYLYGKGDELLFTDSSEITRFTTRYNKLYASDVREYGYTRLQDAKRCYSYTHPDNSEYWTSKAYVVEYDVCGSEVTEV